MGHALAGEAGLLSLAFLVSEHRRAIRWRTVLAGVVLQWALALLLTRFSPAIAAVRWANRAADAVQAATLRGTGFVFGYLGGGRLPFRPAWPGAGFILAFQALPLVIVISALAALLFYWGVLQRITAVFAFVLRRTMGLSGALALGAAVHVFVGMIEAPLLVRPYLARMARGELFALMSCGMAGVAGTVMVIYAGFLRGLVAEPLGQILTASVISTPAAVAVAAVMVPFAAGADATEARMAEARAGSALDALVRGTLAGIPILAGIVAVLIVAVALVALVNHALALAGVWGGGPITLQRLFAIPFRPLLWLIGVPWRETAAAAGLMATKTVLNEFVAYRALAGMGGVFDPRTRVILTYSLCGFANFGSLGILLGGLGAMVPERRDEVVALGLRAILSGTLATCMSGAVAGWVVR
ncbi:MAG: NupC/NupG family nucleoside CNT transporter [Acetobacteraceae bacterium]